MRRPESSVVAAICALWVQIWRCPRRGCCLNLNGPSHQNQIGHFNWDHMELEHTQRRTGEHSALADFQATPTSEDCCASTVSQHALNRQRFEQRPASCEQKLSADRSRPSFVSIPVQLNRQPHPHRLQHSQQRLQGRILLGGQRTVKRFPADTSLRSDHTKAAIGLDHIAQGQQACRTIHPLATAFKFINEDIQMY